MKKKHCRPAKEDSGKKKRKKVEKVEKLEQVTVRAAVPFPGFDEFQKKIPRASYWESIKHLKIPKADRVPRLFGEFKRNESAVWHSVFEVAVEPANFSVFLHAENEFDRTHLLKVGYIMVWNLGVYSHWSRLKNKYVCVVCAFLI